MIQPKRLLVFRQSSLGDVILTLPVLERLHSTFPDTRIDYVTKEAYAPLLQDHPLIERLYAFSTDSEFFRLASALRKTEYSMLIDLQANFRSIWLRTLTHPGRTLKYNKRRIAREMVVRKPQEKLRVNHTIEAYLEALTPLGIDMAILPPSLCLTPEAVNRARAFMAERGISDAKRLIAICPGARHPEKRWPQESFREVARRLLERPDSGIVVISAASDNLPERLGIDHPLVIGMQDSDLVDIAAVLSLCRLAITNDSGLMHLAGAVGTPALAIFGPTNPRLGFAPAQPGSRVICDDVFCSPCSVHGQKPCGQKEKYCFKEITPDRLFREAREILDRKNPA